MNWFSRILGVGRAVEAAVSTAERASDVADTWLPSDADAQRLLLLVRTSLAPGLNVTLSVCAVCLGIWCVGPWIVGSAAYLMHIAPSPAADPDITPIVLLFGLVTTGKGLDILTQYVLDTHARRIPSTPKPPETAP